MMAPRHLALYLALACLGLSGCNIMAARQDWHYKHVNRKRATEAWKTCYSLDKRRCLSCDYEDGFKAGFCDTAIGKDCRVPAVPPSKYWSAKYQCCEGQTAIQDWFRGYQVGITVAQSKGLDSFNDIPVSATAPVLNKSGCGACYSGDPCECLGAGNVPPSGMPHDYSVHPDYSVPQEDYLGPQPEPYDAGMPVPEIQQGWNQPEVPRPSGIGDPAPIEQQDPVEVSPQGEAPSPGDRDVEQSAAYAPRNAMIPTLQTAAYSSLQGNPITIIGGLGSEPRAQLIGPSDPEFSTVFRLASAAREEAALGNTADLALDATASSHRKAVTHKTVTRLFDSNTDGSVKVAPHLPTLD